MTLNDVVRAMINKPIPLQQLPQFPFFIEPKYDGERVLVFVMDGKVKIANRHNSIYEPPEYIVEHLPKEDCILDAEFISKSGKFYDFLSARSKGNDLALAVFDILLSGENDLRTLNYLERREILNTTIKCNEHVFIVESKIVWNREQYEKAKDQYINRGFEGIVIKSSGSYYMSWFKEKRAETVDVVILGITKTKSWLIDGVPFSFLVGIYNNGEFEAIGKVSSGLTLSQRIDLAERLKIIGEDKSFTYVVPEVVLEILYQEKTESGLRVPKILRVRHDKVPAECDRKIYIP